MDAEDAVEYCLDALFKDSSLNTFDFAVSELTYQEIIGALLLARDRL